MALCNSLPQSIINQLEHSAEQHQHRYSNGTLHIKAGHRRPLKQTIIITPVVCALWSQSNSTVSGKIPIHLHVNIILKNELIKDKHKTNKLFFSQLKIETMSKQCLKWKLGIVVPVRKGRRIKVSSRSGGVFCLTKKKKT